MKQYIYSNSPCIAFITSFNPKCIFTITIITSGSTAIWSTCSIFSTPSRHTIYQLYISFSLALGECESQNLISEMKTHLLNLYPLKRGFRSSFVGLLHQSWTLFFWLFVGFCPIFVSITPLLSQIYTELGSVPNAFINLYYISCFLPAKLRYLIKKAQY